MSDPSQRTPLSTLLTGSTASQGGFTVTIPEDWLQGRAIYGGLTAALCLDATLKAFAELPPLRSVQLAFIGPAAPTVELRPALLRRGKSAAFIGTDLIADGALAARATFCFGQARQSSVAADQGLPMPALPAPEACPPLFAAAGTAPNFTRHFEMRRAAGHGPVSAAEAADLSVWVRHEDSEVASLPVGLMALADALPPAAMGLFREPAPVSSMTWMFDILSDAPRTEDGWWLCRSHAEHTRDGYSTQAMQLWNRSGQPIIIGRQNVAVFAR